MTELLVLRDEEVQAGLLAAVRGLVLAAFDGRFDEHDWEHGAGGWRVVAVDDGDPVAHVAVVRRELLVGDRPYDTGYVEAVGTTPGRWGEGLGSLVMGAANDLVRGHFALGALSTSRQAFYQRLGWERWQGPSHVLRATGLQRTPEEDAGLMVLRCGPSADVPLTAKITCHERSGDDW